MDLHQKRPFLSQTCLRWLYELKWMIEQILRTCCYLFSMKPEVKRTQGVTQATRAYPAPTSLPHAAVHPLKAAFSICSNSFLCSICVFRARSWKKIAPFLWLWHWHTNHLYIVDILGGCFLGENSWQTLLLPVQSGSALGKASIEKKNVFKRASPV